LTKKQCGHRPIGIVPVYFLALADDAETGADSVLPKDHVLKTMLLMCRKALHLAQKPCRLVVTEKEVAVRHSFDPPRKHARSDCKVAHELSQYLQFVRARFLNKQ